MKMGKLYWLKGKIPGAFDKTERALQESIRKWEQILNEGGEEKGVNNCPLCELFSDESCRGCPVSLSAREWSCNGTPYEKWIFHHEQKHFLPLYTYRSVQENCEECENCAKEEINFLKSLLNGGRRRWKK